MQSCFRTAIASAIVSLFAQPALAGIEYELATSAEFHSRWVSEARDSANGEALRAAAATLSHGDWAFGSWFGANDKRQYDQLDIGIARSFDVGPIAMQVGYTHLRYYADEALDNEWSISASVAPEVGVELSVESYYSREQRGAWWNFAFSAPLAQTTTGAGAALSLGFNAVLGVNDGYISDGHDGLSGLETGLEIDYRLSHTLGISAYLAHSSALKADADLPGDDNLNNLWFGRVALEWRPLHAE